MDAVGPGGRSPLGAWAVFANHGTVDKATFPYYNGDHVGVAQRALEAALRRGHNAPVLVYGNGDAGDVSAGLDRSGPAAAEAVGRREARAMIGAWRAAGRRLTRRPAIDLRWTRVCFCGQATPAGRLADFAVFGFSYLTGSEEGRGPLFDSTQQVLEGMRLASPVEPQGVKKPTLSDPDRTLEPTAVPLSAVRVGDRMLLAVPGEMTVELGRRLRAAARAALSGSGLSRVVVAGYANEYVSYLTTREEYDAQHYEGGTTVYGPASGPFLTSALADLAGRLAKGSARAARVPVRPHPRAAPEWTAISPGGPGRQGHPPASRHGAAASGRAALARRRRRPRPPARPGVRDGPAPRRPAAGQGGRRPRPAHPLAGGRRPPPAARDPGAPGRPPRHLPGLVGGTARRRHRALPLRGQRHPLPARIAALPGRCRRERCGWWRGGPPGIAGCSSCATRPRCPSAISPRARAGPGWGHRVLVGGRRAGAAHPTRAGASVKLPAGAGLRVAGGARDPYGNPKRAHAALP